MHEMRHVPTKVARRFSQTAETQDGTAPCDGQNVLSAMAVHTM